MEGDRHRVAGGTGSQPGGEKAGIERVTGAGRVGRGDRFSGDVEPFGVRLGELAEQDDGAARTALEDHDRRVFEEVGPFESYPESSFDAVMAVNVKGAFLCCQVVGGAMAREGRGSIVNVSSIYGLLSPVQDLYAFRREGGETFVKPAAYSVSKSAILNLTRYLATYWAKSGVRVNTLTLAGVWNEQPPEFLEAYTARVPMGRMLDAGEALGAVVFLASDASSYVTGANLVVDGGWSAW